MNIKKAIEHFQFKFKNAWRPTQRDVEALNSVINFTNKKHSEQLRDNEMFAKAYVFMYAYFVKHYNTDIFDDIPQKELHRFLDQPIERIVERFKDRLNEKELEDMYKAKGIEVKHPMVETVKEKEDNLSKLGIDDFKESWDFETLKEQLELMINLTLNK